MYSQNKEEQIIVDYFKGETGTFLDVGANDGITLSNTLRLAELGWSGVCLEPSPHAYVRLKKACEEFDNVFAYPFGISKHNGKKILHESGPLLGPNDVGLVSSMNPEELKRWAPLRIQFREVECQFYRWRTFKNRIKFKRFDFISIDTEGNDLIVLEQLVSDPDFAARMVCIEWNGHEESRAMYALTLAGYNIVYTSPENLIFAK